MKTLLQVRDLRVSFFGETGEQPVVDGVSFAAGSGTTLGLVGESGAGKTVTALSIMGLLPESARITSGSILLDGEELVGASESKMELVRGARIGMIFQDPLSSFNPVYTIGAQIGEALRLHQSSADLLARVIQLLALAELPDPAAVAKAYPHQVSGGMRQRAMIAMALAGEPELLIADEPTTALDVTVQAQILDLLARLQRQRGMAIILITHDLGVIASVADDVVVMKDGVAVEAGTVRDVFSKPQHDYTQELLNATADLG